MENEKRKDNEFLFRPGEVYLLVIGIIYYVFISLMLTLGVFYVDSNIAGKITVIIVAIFFICVIHYSYKALSVCIVFEESGIRLFGLKGIGNKCKYKYIPWEEFSYGYYWRGYKGNTWLVLSPKQLDKQIIRKYTNKNGGMGCIDKQGVIVFALGALGANVEQTEAFIKEKFVVKKINFK